MNGIFKTLESDEAFLAKLATTAHYVSSEYDFPGDFELGQEILISFNNGWSGFSVARVTNWWEEGSSIGSMSQEEISALDEDDREALESEPARVMLDIPGRGEETYEYPDLEYYTFDDAALSEALAALYRETGLIPEPGETAIITTAAGVGWALYVGGKLAEGEMGPDPDFDEVLARNGLGGDGSDWEEYRVTAEWAGGLSGGFPDELSGIPVEAYGA